jgi:rod shape-determining protein MreB
VERRAVEEALTSSAREAKVIEESLAAAIGANIPSTNCRTYGLRYRSGTTEISVISLGGMVVTKAIRLGGDEFDEAIIKHVRNVHNLIIGEQKRKTSRLRLVTPVMTRKSKKWRSGKQTRSLVFQEDSKSIP